MTRLQRVALPLCSALRKRSRDLRVESLLRRVLSRRHSALLCPRRQGAADIGDVALQVLGQDRATEMLCTAQAFPDRNGKMPPELQFLPSKPAVWPCQSSRRFGGKRKSSQSGKKRNPASINIHRCSLAGTTHTKPQLKLEGCHDGSTHRSVTPGNTPPATATSSCCTPGGTRPELPQPWHRSSTAPASPARSSPGVTGTWGFTDEKYKRFQSDFMH